jgi:hypothetical protein
MHLYLNYAREHWMKEGENPPVGLILCAEKGIEQAHYALDNLPNKVLAAEYQMVLPDEKVIADELKKSRVQLEGRRTCAIHPPVTKYNEYDQRVAGCFGKHGNLASGIGIKRSGSSCLCSPASRLSWSTP